MWNNIKALFKKKTKKVNIGECDIHIYIEGLSEPVAKHIVGYACKYFTDSALEKASNFMLKLSQIGVISETTWYPPHRIVRAEAVNYKDKFIEVEQE